MQFEELRPSQRLENISISYRPEIDGLRAIAVLSVLLFHAFPQWLPGGFVGVDIFFVISGYLITSILLKEMSERRFSFLKFYERRARRLLPPLLPVLAVTTMLCVLLLSATQFSDFVKSLKANALFVSNWHFLKSISYFDSPGATTPLLHTWSLSIEEQFYFVFPALLLLMTKISRKAVVPLIVVMLIASLVLAEQLIAKNKLDAAFYNSAARFWELLIGGLLGAIPQLKLSNRLATVLEVIGTGLVATAILAYDQQTRFPGASALVPTLGAALLIATGGKGVIASALASRPLTAIGLISYSLYLWHWPLMAAAHLITPTPGPLMMSMVVLTSLLLAWLSYVLIERPIRTRRVIAAPKAAWTVALMAVIGTWLLSLSLATPTMKEQQKLVYEFTAKAIYPKEKVELLEAIAVEGQEAQQRFNLNFSGKSGEFNLDKFDKWTCSFDYENSLSRLEECVVRQATGKDILVMGDSIGRDTTHALRIAFPDRNFIMLHQSSCPPGESQKCFKGQRQLLKEIKEKVSFDAVVLAYRYHPSNFADVEPGVIEAGKITPNVYLLGVSPMFALPMTDYIKSLPFKSMPGNAISESDREMVLWSYKEMRDKARAISQRHGAKFVNVLPFFCDDAACGIWAGGEYGKPLFFDQQHLTPGGIESYGAFLRSRPELSIFL